MTFYIIPPHVYSLRVKKLIALIEDDQDIRESLEVFLNVPPYELLVFKGGREALAYLQTAERLPDCVLTDLRMPYFSGEELIRFCQRDERLKNMPFIILTAKFFGYEDFYSHYPLLRKPFNVDQLLQLIEQEVNADIKAR